MRIIRCARDVVEGEGVDWGMADRGTVGVIVPVSETIVLREATMLTPDSSSSQLILFSAG